MILTDLLDDYSTYLVFVAVFLTIYLRQRSINSLPPGPTPLPIVGNLLSYGNDPWKTVTNWVEQYGDLMTLYQGPFRKVIWINDVKLGIELFQKQPNIFSERKPIPFLTYMLRPEGSIVWENGPAWKTRRRWMISALRHFGMGKRSLEIQIKTEAEQFCQGAASYQCKPFNPQHIVNCAVANIICSISFGKRYDYLDPEFVELSENLLSMFEQMNLKNIEVHFPWITILPMFKYKARAAEYLVNFIKNQVTLHMKQFDPNNIRDLIDKLLAEVEFSSDEEKALFDPEILWASIMTIFLAGAETTSSTLMWFFVYLATFQDVQEKVHEELDRVLEGKKPTMDDRARLPYFEATTYEVQRLGNIAGTTLPHGAAEECVIKGYKIPKDSIFMLNLYRIHTNPKYWDDPLIFNPSRFLEEDGQTVKRPESFMPFGIGRRACLGESMAKMEMFIFMSTFFQNFKLEIPEGHPKPDLKPNLRFTLCPKPFEVCAIPRI